MAALSRIKAQTAATEVDVTDISRIENENKDVLLYEIETTLYLLDRLYTVQVSSHEGILTDSMQQTWNNLLDSEANLSRGPQIGPPWASAPSVSLWRGRHQTANYSTPERVMSTTEIIINKANN